MTKTMTALCSLIALLAGWGAASAAAQAPRDDPPESYKIAYVLQKTARAARSAQAEGRRDLSAMSTKLVPISAQKLKVVVHAAKPPSAAEEAELLALGAEIDTRLEVPAELGLPPVGQVQIWLPIDRLADLAALDWVVAVTPVAPSTTHQVGGGRIVSEGVAIMRARGAQMDGVTGRGVTVGVMSDGVDSLADAQTRGELPLDVEVLDPGQGDEGTAMLEIVHDMAPGANLVFATGSGDTPSYVKGLIALSGSVDVIAEDIGLPGEPKFQQGVAAAVADAIAATGIDIYSAAGNSGESHVQNVRAVGTGRGPDGFDGPFEGCTVPPLNTVAFANGDNTVDVEFAGNGNPIILQWSEPRAIFPTALAGGFTNLDLYLLDESGRVCLDESLGRQGNGRGDPIEFIIAPADFSRGKIVVNVRRVTSPDTPPPVIDLNLFESADILDEGLAGRASSFDPDSNYLGAASNVGALNAVTRRVENYSSAGPILLGLTTDIDDDFSPLVGDGVKRLPGPTFTGVDNNSISGAGGFGDGACPARRRGACRFPGTSASAPHAAGCAALVREARGLTDTADVRQVLIDTARDIARPGEDFVSGAGLLDCRAAARAE